MILFDDDYFMHRALQQAEIAFDAGEVPVGAVAVKDGQIIARASNQVETLKDATAHAEILVITEAANALGDWRLDEVDIYVTKEPCAMCAGAMVNSRVRRVIYGMPDSRTGACGSAMDITGFKGMLWNVEVKSGVLENECRGIVQEFFQNVRKNKNLSGKKTL
jgi:tRNA(adenine34) deaminase